VAASGTAATATNTAGPDGTPGTAEVTPSDDPDDEDDGGALPAAAWAGIAVAVLAGAAGVLVATRYWK
jgi:hypothetical protein